MEYEQFLGIFANHDSSSDYNKDLDELRKKYAELECKLNKELKRKEQEIKEKDKGCDAKDKKIISLENKLKDKWSSISKEVPFYALTSTTAAGLIGAGLYFGGYMAAVDIGAVVGAVTCATAGAIFGKVDKDLDYVKAKIGAAAGAIGGAVCGPAAYGFIPAFEKMPEIADLIARSSIGGAASIIIVPVAVIAFCIFVDSCHI